MGGLERGIGVLRRAAVSCDKFSTEIFSNAIEVWLVVSCSERFGELLPDWRETVVRLVAACPELLWELLAHSVRYVIKLDLPYLHQSHQWVRCGSLGWHSRMGSAQM
jgi:hypothetical protein